MVLMIGFELNSDIFVTAFHRNVHTAPLKLFHHAFNSTKYNHLSHKRAEHEHVRDFIKMVK